jgi:hypothetical protein
MLMCCRWRWRIKGVHNLHPALAMVAILLISWLRLLRIMAFIVMIIMVGIWLFSEPHRSITAISNSIAADDDDHRLTHLSRILKTIFKIFSEKSLIVLYIQRN